MELKPGVLGGTSGLKSPKRVVANKLSELSAFGNWNPFRLSPSVPLEVECTNETAQRLLGKDLRHLSKGDIDTLKGSFFSDRNAVVRNLSRIWSHSSPKYNEVRADVYDKWYTYFDNGSSEHRKLEKFTWLLGNSPRDFGSESLQKSLEARFTWIDEVERNLEVYGSTAEDYFMWVGDLYDKIFELVEEPAKFGGAIKPDVFKASLEKADWREANDESAIVNTMLLYGSSDDHPPRPHYRLGGTFEGFRLGLRLNGRALAIRDADASTLEFYETRELNPKILLGMRFDSIDSPAGGDGVEKTMEKKNSML